MPVVPLLLACTAAAGVCRFTVRDIGFVDLAGPAYELVFVAEPSVSAESALETMHRGSNVRFAPVDPTAQPEHPAVQALGARGEDQRAAYVMTTAGREPLVIWPWSARAPAGTLALALDSELRGVILAEALDTFAFVLVVEGTNVDANRAVQDIIDRAEGELARLSTQLPRPITHPLRRLTLTRDERPGEAVLLWSLGLDDPEAREPAVCVLYGRGKLAGPVMDAAALEEGELLMQLALVGESCECDTNRDWMAEPVIPLAWTKIQREGAWDALGFDPDSPMVKAEVASILRPAPGPNVARKLAVRDELEALVFGYRETALGSDAVRTPVPIEADTTMSADLRTIDAGRGDWGFEDDEVSAEAPGSSSFWLRIGAAIFVFSCASAFLATRVWLRRRRA